MPRLEHAFGPAVCPPISDSAYIGEYEGTLRAIIHAFKYGTHRSLARQLGDTMACHGRAVLDGADACVPVPLHWVRRWRRGFNQASLLASRLGLPVWPALKRVHATRPQVELPAEERRRNVRGAFQVARRTRRHRALTGKVIVLVDDVATTGSTLEACALVLRRAGAREVRALTAARVPGPR